MLNRTIFVDRRKKSSLYVRCLFYLFISLSVRFFLEFLPFFFFFFFFFRRFFFLFFLPVLCACPSGRFGGGARGNGAESG